MAAIQVNTTQATNTCTRSPNYLVGFDQLNTEYGIRFSRVHLRRLEAQGKFPRRIQVSEKRVAWLASALETYIANMMASADTVGGAAL